METRTYPLPAAYLQRDIFLVETPGPCGNFKARITGIIRFTACWSYRDEEEFYADGARHLVGRDSPWRWQDKQKWGWAVEVVRAYDRPVVPQGRRGIIFTQHLKASLKC